MKIKQRDVLFLKKGIAVFAFAALVIMLSSCTHGDDDFYAKIKEKYSDLKSFRAEIAMTIKSGDTENVYNMHQVYAAPERFAVTVDSPEELAGYKTVIDGDGAVLKSGFGESERLEGVSAEGMSNWLLPSFFEKYFENGSEPHETIVGFYSTMMLCCETEIDGALTRLFLDKETYLPVRLEICGDDNSAAVTIEYREFEMNCETDEKDFE